jgi:hypothetical protein
VPFAAHENKKMNNECKTFGIQASIPESYDLKITLAGLLTYSFVSPSRFTSGVD